MNRSKSRLIWPVSFGIACLLQYATTCLGQVSTPVIGVARLGDGSLRILYGVPDNVIVDSQSLDRVEAASFSDAAGLVLKSGRIELLDRQFHVLGEYDTADANALLNIDGGAETAIAWLPGSETLLHLEGSAFQPLRVQGLEHTFKITSLRRNGSTADLLLSNANGNAFQGSVSLKTGELTSLAALQGINGTAFWAGKRILFADSNGLAVQEHNGAVERLETGADNLAFTHMSSQWVLVTSATTQRSWAVNLGGAHVRVSEIPAVPATVQEGVR